MAADLPQGILRTALSGQYHAALEMLRHGITQCPDEMWNETGSVNEIWQLGYHTLFFAHMYLMGNLDDFTPWQHHQTDAQYPDGIGGPADSNSSLRILPDVYTKEQVLDYWHFCDDLVDQALGKMDLQAAVSGFYWYDMPKFEHQLVNIRHIQHHAAQIADRLRNLVGIGVDWKGSA